VHPGILNRPMPLRGLSQLGGFSIRHWKMIVTRAIVALLLSVGLVAAIASPAMAIFSTGGGRGGGGGCSYSTATALSSSAAPSVWGQSVTYTATVTSGCGGPGTGVGSVTFTDGALNLGTVSLNGLSQASVTTTQTPLGTSAVGASYSGGAGYSSSGTSLNQTVGQANTTTTVTSSSASAVFGQSVTFTATVAAVSPGSGTPTGTVTFEDGTTPLSGRPR
jgi:hypothetical protein